MSGGNGQPRADTILLDVAADEEEDADDDDAAIYRKNLE